MARKNLSKDHKQNHVLRFYIENYCKIINIINRLNAEMLRQIDLLQECAVTVGFTYDTKVRNILNLNRVIGMVSLHIIAIHNKGSPCVNNEIFLKLQ
jgi:hypothetical protein